jgi:hypothetical protein
MAFQHHLKDVPMSKETTDGLNLPASVLAISGAMQKDFTVGDDGVITFSKDLWKEVLPEGLTAETVKKVQSFSEDFYLATGHATGALSPSFLKKHKDVASVSVPKLPLGKDRISYEYERETQVTSPKTGAVTKYGWLTGKYTTAAASKGSSNFGKLRSTLAEEGAKLFGG